MAAHYEITYIIKPDLDEAGKTAVVEKYDKILKDNGAEIIDSKDWDKRHLAYEIAGYHEGLYHVANINANDTQATSEFDRLSKIDESVLRHMIVKIEG